MFGLTNHSIRWRIGLPYTLLIVITLLGLGIYLSNFIKQTYLDVLNTQLESEARFAGEILTTYFEAEADSDQLDSLAKRWADALGLRITIIDLDGTVLGESHEDRRTMSNHGGRPEVVQAILTGKGSSTRFSSTMDYQMMYVAIPIKSKDGEVIGFVRTALPLTLVQANLEKLLSILISASLIATTLAILLAIWIARRTTNPLLELERAAIRVSEGKLDTRLIPTSNDEIGQLTKIFNEMTMTLKTQIEVLDAERSRLSAVMGVINDGVIIVDTHGNIQLMNPAAENMFVFNSQDALDNSLIKVVRHHQVDELWQNCRSSGESQSKTLEIPQRGLYLQVIATPLGQALPGNILLLFQNLTRLRRLETVRQDFISNISHELRTPLASLRALTETLQGGALDDPPAAQRFLQHMETELNALSQMVEELLELSRIESGRVPLKMSPTRPIDLITKSVERLHLQAERAKLNIIIDCQEDLPFVITDSSRLERVLVNLLHNAIKFTPAGGEIQVRASSQSKNVIFSVVDTGIGIPSDDLPRIFERFYKTDRARAGSGTGLGLAIARHLVEAHGGHIWAESIEGKGSTFSFSIPMFSQQNGQGN